MNKSFFYTLLILLIHCFGFTQVSNDSIDKLNSISWENSDKDIINAIENANLSKKLNPNAKYKKGYIENELSFGLIYYLTGDLKKALTHTNNALKFNSTLKTQAKIHNQLGRIYTDLVEYEKAEKNLHKAISINHSIKDSSQIQGNLINLGNLKSLIYQIDSAYYYLEEGLKIAKKLKDTTGIIITYNNLGILNGNLNELGLERKYYLMAFNIIKPSSSNQKSHLAFNIATSFFQSNQLEETENYLKIALRESEKSNSLKGLKNSYELYGKLEKRKNNFKNSLNYYLLYFDAFKKLMNEDIKISITKIQLESEFQNQLKIDSIKKNKEIQIIKQENLQKEKLQEEELKRTNSTLIFSLIILLLMIIISIRVYKINIERRKANATINEQKIKVEKQKDLIEEKQKGILDSITYAKRLQNAILPTIKDIKNIFSQSFILNIPKDIVSGDFYWFESIEVNESKDIFFAVADCTGHGVPGAMVSVVCANGLTRSIKEFDLKKPSEILEKTKDILVNSFNKGEETINDGMDIALCHFNPDTNILQYSGAFNPLIIVSKNESLSTSSKFKTQEFDGLFLHEIKADKQPIGRYEYNTSFTNHTIKINKGDSIYLFSDGYADQFSESTDKKFKIANLKRLFIQNNGKDQEEIKKVLEIAFTNWKGKIDQIDDVCIMGIRI